LTHVTPACSPLFSSLQVTSTGTPSPSKASSSRSIGRESSCNTCHWVGALGPPKTVTYFLERPDGGTTHHPPTYGFHLARIVHQYQRLLGRRASSGSRKSCFEASVQGTSSRLAYGVLGSPPLVVGGLILMMLPYLDNPVGKIALPVVGGGFTGSIYIFCPPIIGEFTPVSQRASVVAIDGWRSGAGCKWQNGCVLEMPPRCSKLACGPQDHRTSQILRRAGRPGPATAGRRDGTTFAARPRKDRSVIEAKGPHWRARPPGCADVAGPEIYWRSYLTTRRTRPHSPGCTT
jgi:hypothetical protein